jgi:hypothetical protein
VRKGFCDVANVDAATIVHPVASFNRHEEAREVTKVPSRLHPMLVDEENVVPLGRPDRQGVLSDQEHHVGALGREVELMALGSVMGHSGMESHW